MRLTRKDFAKGWVDEKNLVPQHRMAGLVLDGPGRVEGASAGVSGPNEDAEKRDESAGAKRPQHPERGFVYFLPHRVAQRTSRDYRALPLFRAHDV